MGVQKLDQLLVRLQTRTVNPSSVFSTIGLVIRSTRVMLLCRAQNHLACLIWYDVADCVERRYRAHEGELDE